MGSGAQRAVLVSAMGGAELCSLVVPDANRPVKAMDQAPPRFARTSKRRLWL